VTPKGTAPGARSDPSTVTRATTASSRYTPPIPRSVKVSPPWVPVVMFSLFAIGIVAIFLNYVGVLLPGATNNWYLVTGLLCILGGIVAATQYR
jgi:hypothetical protein